MIRPKNPLFQTKNMLKSYWFIQRYIALAACVAVMAGLPQGAAFADESTAALRKQLDETYERTLKHPNDRALSLEYAAIAMKLNDYEAAISPLERILMNEPQNAKIRMQIGVLYRSLGSKLIAKQYFEEAASTKGAPPDVVEEAKGYLNAM